MNILSKMSYNTLITQLNIIIKQLVKLWLNTVAVSFTETTVLKTFTEKHVSRVMVHIDRINMQMFSSIICISNLIANNITSVATKKLDWKQHLTRPAVNMAEKAVDRVIRFKPAVVFPDILGRRHWQHQYDRSQSDLWLEGLHNRNKVKSSEEDEVDIGQAMELLKQILGQEGEERILCGPNLVAFIRLQKLNQFLILCEGRYHRPLLPQALLGRVKTGRMFQAIHESTAPVDSDLPARFMSPLRSLTYLQPFSNCNFSSTFMLSNRPFWCWIFSPVPTDIYRHGRQWGNGRIDW